MSQSKNHLQGVGLLERDPTIIRTLIILIGVVQTVVIGLLWSGLRQETYTYIVVGLTYVCTIAAYLCYTYISARAAAVCLVVSLWLNIAVPIFFPISDDDLGLGYLNVAIIASYMLLGRYWGAFSTVCSSLLLITMVILRLHDRLPTPIHADIYSLPALYNELAIYLFIGAMLFIVMGHLQRASRESAAANQALRDKTELLELITGNVPAHITYFDTDERYIFVNNKFEQLHESVPNPVGKRRVEVVTESVYQTSKPFLERAFKGENVQFDYQFAPNGKVERITEIQYTPLIVEDKPQGVIALATDVTRMRRTESALYEAQRAESLGVVAGGIAHDFNNLLSAMLGQASLAKLKLEADHPARTHIDRTIDATQRASQLTKQMLAYSGRGTFEKHVFDLNQLLRDNADLLRISIPKQITLDMQRVGETRLHIKADMAQMQQVVMNLILNAAQAIQGESGNIWLETDTVYLKSATNFGRDQLPAGEYVCCTVRDDGHGMSEEVQKRIFDPFYTTKENGSGLGLAAVSGIVYGHGGGLRVTSTVGNGTKFELLLPLVKYINLGSEANADPAGEISGGSVLLIDDEQVIADVVGDVLSLHGITMLYAERGEKGIECYRANRATVDVVLLDLTMPGMSGTEVFHHLRRIDPNLPIVISSGYTRDAEAQEIIDRGSADFLPKPYDISALVSTLGRYLPQQPS